MKTTLALASLVLALSTFACAAGTEPAPPENTDQARTAGKGEAPPADTTEPPAAGDKSGKGAPSAEPPADPTCVQRCEESLRTKCQGDGDFCTGTCRYQTTAFVGCLAAAASCAKTEWIRCKEAHPTPKPEGDGEK